MYSESNNWIVPGGKIDTQFFSMETGEKKEFELDYDDQKDKYIEIQIELSRDNYRHQRSVTALMDFLGAIAGL